MENITYLPYVKEMGNFKELNDQVKLFVIGNLDCKFTGFFSEDSGNRSFLEKYYNIVSISDVEIERTWLSYPLLLHISNDGYKEH